MASKFSARPLQKPAPMFRFEARHPASGERLDVHARYFPARRGSRDCDGAPLEPDGEEELLICHVWNRRGEPVPFDRFEESLVERGLRCVREKGDG